MARKLTSAALSLLVGFLLTSCTSGPTAPTQSPATFDAPAESNWTPAPGFYPGELDKSEAQLLAADYATYMAKAGPAIDQVKQRIAAIQAGADTPGCIGRDAVGCMATMASYLAVTTSFSQGAVEIETNEPSKDPLITQSQLDVNGKPIFVKELWFNALLPGVDAGIVPSTDAMTVIMYLSQARQVDHVDILLRRNPLSARTQSEYDATGLYPVMEALCLPTSLGLSNIGLYQFVENKVKPGLTPTHDLQASMEDIQETNGQETEVPLCGRKLHFYSFSGNAVSAVTELNTTGIIGGATLTIY